MKSESFVSVVFVVDCPTPALQETVIATQGLLDANYADYEIVLIAQGPLTGQNADKLFETLLSICPSIRYIQLATKVHSDIAWAAGLENSIGDFIVLLDHTRDPINILPELVSQCRSGIDILVGVTQQVQPFFYSVFRWCSGALLQAIDYHLPGNATGLRCLSRRAANAVIGSGRFHHQFYMRIQKTGYPSSSFPYRLKEGKYADKSIPQGLRYLIRLLVFNSSKPLRWMSALGFFGSFTAFISASFSLLIHLFNGNIVQGWTTTIFFMSMLFMIQFIMMAFFGEYIGRLLDDRSEQSDYSIVFEKNSAIMVNGDRVNVMASSLPPEQNLVQTGRAS
ncbi:MAG: glycosyl transferase family 2 [Rhodocyclales bacterium GT-UBC]|nr:MAG: glycosyl transferase family 2 [Rhodocyclales bacterium GT-UBC]